MTEFIINDKQLKTATEAYLERELSRPITEVFISGDKLPEIVRCRDCSYYEAVPEDSGDWCGYWTDRIYADARGSGFCAWGVKEES